VLTIIHVTPMGAPRTVRSDVWRERPVITRYHAYRDAIREALPDHELPMEIILHFYVPMPKSWSKKKQRAMAMEYHQQKPDIDNLVKGFMDAFRKDDSKVAVVTAQKFWGTEGKIEYFHDVR